MKPELLKGHITPSTEFGRALKDIVIKRKPSVILETGTHVGLGSTLSILEGIQRAKYDAKLISIEVNPRLHQLAIQHLTEAKMDLTPHELLHGCSLPKGLLPSAEQLKIMRNKAVNLRLPGMKKTYFQPLQALFTDYDLIGKAVRENNIDMVLLDSAGHLGWLEFQYVMQLMEDQEFILALDDIYIVKHAISATIMTYDPRFSIIVTGNERAGYCIMSYNPKG